MRDCPADFYPPLMQEQEWFSVRTLVDTHSFVLNHVGEGYVWRDSLDVGTVFGLNRMEKYIVRGNDGRNYHLPAHVLHVCNSARRTIGGIKRKVECILDTAESQHAGDSRKRAHCLVKTWEVDTFPPEVNNMWGI